NEALLYITDPNQDPFLRNPFQDTTTFKDFYGYSWRPHWDADENANWRSYSDLNNNGVWDSNEPLNNDVGSDGLGLFDTGYPGPDFDGTEANGKPDQGEPNFGILDKDESDQLGLTGFKIYAVHTYELDNDEENWGVLSGLPAPHGQTLIGVNLANYFSCYLFSMNGRNTYSVTTGEIQEEGETERFSMSMIFGISKDDLFRRKKTVQQIYNANYRFAKPPEKPILTAIPGDKKVTLYWDDRAEKSFDEFYQRVNFEGYRIYRSTEPNFLENKIITDAYGKSTFRLPLVQYDLIDDIKGLHPIDVNGAMFYLGDDSGLKHSFIDTTVQNGQTYYYAIAAYDQGFVTTNITGVMEGIPPSETTTTLKKDINGNITTDINTAVITPRTTAAGYLAPEVASFEGTGPGTGNISVTILNPDSIRHLNTYRIIFDDDLPYHNSAHPDFSLINVLASDSLIKQKTITDVEEQTPVIDGFTIDIKSDTAVMVDFEKTGWKTGSSNYIVQVGFDSRYQSAYIGKKIDYPADFEITLTEPGQGDLSYPATAFSQPIQSNITIKNLTENTEHFQFIFRDNNSDGIYNENDAIFLAFGDSLGKRATNNSNLHVSWSISLFKDTTIAESDQRPPEFGDVFKVVNKKPFRKDEFYEFT
ncbi:MAG TPA: hypothetical protein VF870_07785, partial [Ignavibacteriaceae bacterium]